MHPEVAVVIADRELRSQHRPSTRSKRDTLDEALWTYHDSHHTAPYAACELCDYLWFQVYELKRLPRYVKKAVGEALTA